MNGKKIRKISTLNVYKFGKRCKIAAFGKVVMRLRNGTGPPRTVGTDDARRPVVRAGDTAEGCVASALANFMNQTFMNNLLAA